MLFGETVAVYCRSHITTDGQPLCQGIEPTLELVTKYYFLSEGYFPKFAVLSLWGTLSDERSGLSLAVYCENRTEHTDTVWAECTISVC
jgi:hypothetical protein